MADDPDSSTDKSIFNKIFLGVLRYISWPIGMLFYYLFYYLFVAIFFILNVLYHPLAFLLQPFVYLGRFILACIMLPFQLLVKLETIYIFLGVAAIVGLAGGLTIAILSGSLNHLLGLDVEEPAPQPRTVKQYRESRQRGRSRVEPPMTLLPDALTEKSPGHLSPTGYRSHSDDTRKGRRGRGLLDLTIDEEEEVDSDF